MQTNQEKLEITLKEYAKNLSYLAELQSNDTFSNSSAETKAIAIAAIFKYAKGEVRIFAGNLEGAVSNNAGYLQALNSLLERGVRLKLLLEYLPDKKTEAFNIILSNAELFPNQTQIRKISSKSIPIIKTNNNLTHFVIGDYTMVQIDQDVLSYKGIVTFNNPEFANKLIHSFDRAFEQADQVGSTIPIQKNPNLDSEYLKQIINVITKIKAKEPDQ